MWGEFCFIFFFFYRFQDWLTFQRRVLKRHTVLSHCLKNFMILTPRLWSKLFYFFSFNLTSLVIYCLHFQISRTQIGHSWITHVVDKDLNLVRNFKEEHQKCIIMFAEYSLQYWQYNHSFNICWVPSICQAVIGTEEVTMNKTLFLVTRILCFSWGETDNKTNK